jgi:predicted helicase
MKMNETLVDLAILLSEECGWPINADDFDSSWGGPFWDYSKEELGLPDDMDIELAGYQLIPAQGFEDKMRIYFLSIEGSGRLHVTRLRAILKELARKNRRPRPGEGAAIDVGVEDIIFVCSLLEPKNTTRYFCHFQDKEDGKRPKLMIGPKWEDAQSKEERDNAVTILRENLQWPEQDKDLDEWRDEWSKAFTVEHLYVPKTSKQLAKRLAVLAAQIRESIPEMYKLENEKGPIHTLLKAFREALIKDLKLSDFADMVAQTITYGLFSARATGSELSGIETLSECIPSTNPFLRDLFSKFASLAGNEPTDLDFDDLSLDELVEMLNGVNIDAVLGDFGSQFKGGKEDPVIHFYETFLSEYDQQRRVERGVFYTPKPVVNFIVRSVHDRLIEDFDLPLGLADTSTHIVKGKECPKVMILDPATGTGTFLEATIDIIHKTMLNHWISEGNSKSEIPALWNDYVDNHLLPRLYGFELMMAPYSIAHLKLGMKLMQTGYSSSSETRLNVYLTNTLTEPTPLADWIPNFISIEASTANHAKQNIHFSVVIGNPPYSGISANMSDSNKALIDEYKMVDGEKLDEKKIWLQDDYVKFTRIAQKTIEKSAFGIIGYITNHGYLENPTFRGMRNSLMNTFQRISVIDLHGNTNKKETSPDGSKDDPVFDIRQGVAILIATRKPQTEQIIEHTDVWGSRVAKYSWLDTNESSSQLEFELLSPQLPLYLFKPFNIELLSEYELGWSIPDIFPTSSVGFISARDSLTIQFDEKGMWDTVKRFSEMSEKKAREHFSLGKDARDWKVSTALDDVKRSGPRKELIYPVLYRPFDKRYTYYTGTSRGFYASPCSAIMRQMILGKNIALSFSRREEIKGIYSHFLVTDYMTEHGLLSSKTTNYHAPLFLIDDGTTVPNLNRTLVMELSEGYNLESTGNFGFPEGIDALEILNYIYAICHSTNFRIRYGEYLRLDYPKIQFTSDLGLFKQLAKLGDKIVQLHLMKNQQYPPDCNFVLPPDKEIGVDSLVEKISFKDNTVWINKGETIGFRGVAQEIWDFRVGGYQICKKWLSDRKPRGGLRSRPGVVLSSMDIEHYRGIIYTIKQTMQYMREVDDLVENSGGWPLNNPILPVKNIVSDIRQKTLF